MPLDLASHLHARLGSGFRLHSGPWLGLGLGLGYIQGQPSGYIQATFRLHSGYIQGQAQAGFVPCCGVRVVTQARCCKL